MEEVQLLRPAAARKAAPRPNTVGGALAEIHSEAGRNTQPHVLHTQTLPPATLTYMHTAHTYIHTLMLAAVHAALFLFFSFHVFKCSSIFDCITHAFFAC